MPARVTAASPSTRQRILRAAESLFAEHGFAATSMRQVTAEAGVNLAAVNYHFGSKNSLIEEVLRLRLDGLSQRRRERLATATASADPKLEDLLGAFVWPALELTSESDDGHSLMRLLARAYAEHDERLRAFLSEHYGHDLKCFAKAFGEILPELGKEELYWRLDMIAGALTYAMADFGITKRRGDISDKQHHQQAAKHLIRFAAAGLQAR